jgi:tRNA pseudouridine55 synthase
MLVGKAATLQETLTNHDKTYIAGVRLGIKTDTGDITGKILENQNVQVSDEQFCSVLKSFVGKQEQIPPMYSAIKSDGQRLYDLARKGIEIERTPRPIEIYGADLVQRVSDTDFMIEVSCSKGTYIRTLCEDIATRLGTVGTMFSLERTVCGEYKKQSCVSLDELEQLFISGKSCEIEKYILPVEPLFAHLPKVVLSEFYTKLCLNGCEIYLDKARIDKNIFKNTLECRLYTFDDRFIGIASLGEYDEGMALKVKHRFID